MEFPKIIHQIWLQGELNIPEKFHANFNKNKSYCKKEQRNKKDEKQNDSWKYILWDEIKILDLLQKFHKEAVKTYYSFDYLVQRVDYAKYVILYVYGGVYVDMDAEIIKPLDKLLHEYKQYDTLVSESKITTFERYVTCGNNRFVNNGVIVSKPNSPVMEDLIKKVSPKGSSLQSKMYCILETTGPCFFTRIIYDNIDKVKILGYEYFEPCIKNQCNVTNNTYIIHRHESSWIPDSLKSLFVYYYANKMIVYALILIIIIALGVWIFRRNS